MYIYHSSMLREKNSWQKRLFFSRQKRHSMLVIHLDHCFLFFFVSVFLSRKRGIYVWLGEKGWLASERNRAQGKNLTGVAVELGSVLYDSLADCLKIFHLAVSIVGEQRAEAVNVLLFARFFAVRIRTQLQQDLII